MDIERIVVRLVADTTQYFGAISAVESRLITFSAAGLAAATAASLKLAASFEQTAVAFEVMTGSAEKAKEILDDITKLAIETPFKSGPLLAAAQSLKSYGIAADALVPTLRVLGDVASGGGANISLDEKLGRVVLAFGQVRTAGRLMGTEVRQFTEAGIPIYDELAKVMGKPATAIKGLVEEGQVGFAQVAMAFNNMVGPGGQFFGMMDKQSQTVAGRWSALVENIQVGMRNLGLAFFKGFGLADLLDEMGKFTSGMGTQMGKLENFFGRVREVFDVVVAAAGVLGEAIQDALGKTIEQMTGLAPSWENTKSVIVDVVKVVVTMIGGMVDAIKKALGELANVARAVGNIMQMSGLGGSGSPPSIYELSRSRGNSTPLAIAESVGGNLTYGVLSVFGYGEEFMEKMRDEDADRLGRFTSGPPGVNPLEGIAVMMEKLSAPTNEMNGLFEALEKRLAALNNRASSGVGYFGQLADQIEKSIKSKMPVDWEPSPKAIELINNVSKAFAAGVSPLEHFKVQVAALADAARGGLPEKEFQMLAAGGIFGARSRLKPQELEYAAGTILDGIRKATGPDFNFPRAMFRGTAESQDAINRAIYEPRKSVEEEIAAGIQELVVLAQQRRAEEEEALRVLREIERKKINIGVGGI